jgi:hypothetical protein
MFSTVLEGATSELVTVTAVAQILGGSEGGSSMLAGIRKVTARNGYATFNDLRLQVSHEQLHCESGCGSECIL